MESYDDGSIVSDANAWEREQIHGEESTEERITRLHQDAYSSRHRVLALPMQGGVCDVCHGPPSSEVAMLFDANDNPTVALCVDCAAACIQVALRVKMQGLVLQWRTQAAIKAERIARDEAAKAQRRNRKETTNASE